MTSTSTTAKVLADIIADADRMSPEQIADIIREADLHGTPEDLEDTPAGNYVAHHALLAGVAPALYAIVMGERLHLVNSRTRAILATADITGTLYDLQCLVEDDNDPNANPGEYFGFGDLLIDPDDPETMILSPADHDPEVVGPLYPHHVTTDDAEFFEAITHMRENLAA